LASAPHFPPHFKTAVALLVSAAQLKNGTAAAVVVEQDAVAAGMQ
jgi:hypothetical protein